jgi:cell division control protein 45
MLLFPEHWHFGYEQIKTDCQAGEEGQSVLLLCNADVDAIASARIVSYMLRSDGVHYQLLPCTNYAALNKHLRTVQLDAVRAIVLLNFGAARNLSRLFEEHPDLNENTKVYVMDCRRPVHLGNVHAGANVVVFMDGTQTNDQIPSDGDNLSGNESSSDEEEASNSEGSSDDDDSSGDDDSDKGEESEEEAAFDDVIDATTGRNSQRGDKPEQNAEYDGEDEGETGGSFTRRQRANLNQDDDNGDEDEDDDRSPSEGHSSKRQRTESKEGDGSDGHNADGATDVEQSEPDTPSPAKNSISPRELHRQRRERLRSYYNSGSFFGSPAAFIAYEIAQQLRFGEQGDLLWLACVGVTDAYLHSRVDKVGYTEMAMGLRQSCLKLFPTDMYERAINTVYAEDLSGAANANANGGGASRTGGDRTKITFSDNGRIVAENDYRFFLLRHASLFDSMVHSEFVSTKLQVWTKKGMHKLQELLATMGYPLEECKQPFAFMKPNLRRRLHEKIMSHSEVSEASCWSAGSLVYLYFRLICHLNVLSYPYRSSGVWIDQL